MKATRCGQKLQAEQRPCFESFLAKLMFSKEYIYVII